MRHPARATAWLVIPLLILLLAACGSPQVSAGDGDGDGQEASATPVAGDGDGGGSTAEGLCGAVNEDLAIAALGGEVAEPTGGEVLPRPNGIYCHYPLASDANVNVEAQLKDMTREEFDALVVTLGMDQPLEGIGEAASQRSSSIMGLPGVAIAAWADSKGVTVSINGEGDAAAQLAAASAIAEAALAS